MKLKHHDTIYKTVEKAKLRIQSIPKHELLKLNSRVSEEVGCYVYNKIPTRYKIDRDELIVDIITEVFHLEDNERHILHDQVKDLIERKLIRSLTSTEYLMKYGYKFLVHFFFTVSK